MTRELKLVQHMNLQRPETAAKGDLLLRGDALVAKHQHVVIEVRAVNAREVLCGKRLAQIEAQYFGAYRAVEWANFDGLRDGGAGTGLAGNGGVGSNRHTELFV